jgi:hypothetical protein
MQREASIRCKKGGKFEITDRQGKGQGRVGIKRQCAL